MKRKKSFNKKVIYALVTIVILLVTKAYYPISSYKDLLNFPASYFDTSEGLAKGKKIPATFERHVDGDTSRFIVEGEELTVRYLLIDTPETVKANTPVQPFGLEASNRTKELLEQAKLIELELDKGEKTDKYDRVLAYVFVDGSLVQDILVKEGLAKIAYVKKPSTKYLLDLKKSESDAKLAKRGIWSSD